MLQSVVLKRVYISDKKKDGTPLVNKFGKPFKKVAIQTTNHGDTWISGFANFPNDPSLDWKEGDTVMIEIEQNGDYTNFRAPDPTQLLELRVQKLEKEVARLLADQLSKEFGGVAKPNASGFTAGVAAQPQRAYPTAPPEDDVRMEDIPF